MPKPDDLPESIVLSQFKGVRNTVERERLAPEDLETALNIDLDDAGQAHRRRGFTLKAAGNFHSLSPAGELVVKNGRLCALRDDFTTTDLADGGTDLISYTKVAETIYYSSRTVSGKITAGARSDWGTPGAAQWISPVLRPTATLGAVGGKLLGPPPQATSIEAYSGRIYMAHENVLWATELYLLDLVDRTRTYVQLEGDITVLGSVDDGLYVGTERSLMFLKGALSTGLNQTIISDQPVFCGSLVRAPADRVHPNARNGGPVPAGQALVMMAADGVYAAFAGGECYNLTQGRVVFPQAQSIAALFREQDGVSQYVAVADSAGGLTGNARIGDFVDAEIRRFTGA